GAPAPHRNRPAAGIRARGRAGRACPVRNRPNDLTDCRYAKLPPTRQRSSGGEPLLNNEAINRLRLPAAWALLGAVAAQMVAGLIRTFAGMEGEYGSFSVSGGDFYNPIIVGLVLAAVALVITAPQKTSANFGVVLTGLILLGVGALFALIGLIAGFANAGTRGIGYAFADLFAIAGQAAVLVFAGIFLLRVLNDPNLVPRAQQGYAPQTGAQQPYPAADPSQTYGGQQAFDQAYADPAQQAYADPAQQGYADPAQQGYAATGGQQAYDPAQ